MVHGGLVVWVQGAMWEGLGGCMILGKASNLGTLSAKNFGL